MKLTYRLSADLLDRGVWQSVSAMQYDANTRAVEVTLTAGGAAWTPPEGTAVSVAFKKPDGKKGWYDTLPDGRAACSVSGNVVTAILAPEVLTAAGEVRAAIVFQDGKLNQLATFGFSVLVEANPAAGGSISNNYYKYSTMEAVSDAVEAMLDSLEGTKADIGQLLVQADEAVVKAQQEAGPAIVCASWGETFTVTDSAERSLRGLKLYGKTIQNGTPSLDSPVALESAGSGGSIAVLLAGKNLCDTKSISNDSNNTGVSVSDDGYEIVSVGGTKPYSTAVIQISPEGLRGKELYLKADSIESTKDYPSGVMCECWLSDGSKVWPGSIEKNRLQTVFTIPEDATAIIIVCSTNNSEVAQAEDNTLTVKGLMLSLGGYAPWEQYRPIQHLAASTPNGLPGIPVESGGNYADDDGQMWICDEIDFARGVYVQRVERTIIQGEDWHWNSTTAGNGYRMRAYPGGRYIYTVGTVLCDHLPTVDVWSKEGITVATSSGSKVLYVNQQRFGQPPVLEDWYAYLAEHPITVLLALAKPIETPLSAEELAQYATLHTYKPNTTIYNDAGVEQRLEYVADTKLYIDNKIAAISAAVLNN